MSGTRQSGWIAVVGQLRRDHGRLPLTYVEAVRAAGGRARVLSTFEPLPEESPPADLEIDANLDPEDPTPLEGAAGLMLPGGGDIDPALYGRDRHPRTVRVSHRRDRFELTLLGEALRRDIPVLAICHGVQLLNVHLGGTLDQHLGDRLGVHDHDFGQGKPKSEPAHPLRVKESSRLARILGGTRGEVNSHHHQGLDQVPDELSAVAWADDGVLEAVESRKHSWVVGVQWHPEAMWQRYAAQRRLFEAFVDEVAGAARPARARSA